MSQEKEPQLASEAAEGIDTLDALLRVHQDMLKGRMFIHFGDARMERLAGYIEGYRACMRQSGRPDDEYDRFRVWLRTMNEVPIEEDAGLLPAASPEAHERAIERFLGRVAEFDATRPRRDLTKNRELVARGSKPEGVLLHLLELRQAAKSGKLNIHMREVNVERLNAFVDGYGACLDFNGAQDEEYVRFRDWLREVKKELPAEGWPVKYLRDCEGDHALATLKYLDLVAEFLEPRRHRLRSSKNATEID